MCTYAVLQVFTLDSPMCHLYAQSTVYHTYWPVRMSICKYVCAYVLTFVLRLSVCLVEPVSSQYTARHVRTYVHMYVHISHVASLETARFEYTYVC